MEQEYREILKYSPAEKRNAVEAVGRPFTLVLNGETLGKVEWHEQE